MSKGGNILEIKRRVYVLSMLFVLTAISFYATVYGPTGLGVFGSQSLCNDDFNCSTYIDNGFEFDILSKVYNCNGTYTYRIKVTNNNKEELNYLAVGISDDGLVHAPLGNSLYSYNYDYNVENLADEPFKSVKFDVEGHGLKNGEFDIFEIVVEDGGLLSSLGSVKEEGYDVACSNDNTCVSVQKAVKVKVKAGKKEGYVEIDCTGCNNSLACFNECGNGIVESGEECDDGNSIDGDGCSADCEIEDVEPEVVFYGNDTAYCEYDPLDIKVTGKVNSLSQDVKVIVTRRIVYPDDLRTDTDYISMGVLSHGDEFSFDLMWPGIRYNDTIVEVHAGAYMRDPVTNELIGNTESLDYYWYPWVCPAPSAYVCGNGIVEVGEECDDGNNLFGDGCYDCKIENGDCPQEILDALYPQTNGKVNYWCFTFEDGWSDCGYSTTNNADIHNMTVHTSCSADYDEYGYPDKEQPDPSLGDPAVTNYVIQKWEVDLNKNKCELKNTCQESFVYCGDNIIQPGEECDDGNTNDGDGCSSDCLIEEGPVCGNGIVEAGEECDDGNNLFGDGCYNCQIETEYCPQEILDALYPQTNGKVNYWCFTFEDGWSDCGYSTTNNADIHNMTVHTSCSADYDEYGYPDKEQPDPSLGDPAVTNYVIQKWEVDLNKNKCELKNTCQESFVYCGDNIIQPGEECDDGNTNDGDGCSSECLIEEGPVCGNGIVEAGEDCDDGNMIDYDGCSSECEVEDFSSVKPMLECVKDHGNGSYTARFGYLNENNFSVTIPVSQTYPYNKFNPYPYDRGQETLFLPGRSDPYAGAFEVDFDGNSIVWSLTGPDQNTWSVTAWRMSRKCLNCTDNDCDGFNIEGGDCGPVDCDDYDPSVHPGAVELCDGKDNDCGGIIDEGCCTGGYECLTPDELNDSQQEVIYHGYDPLVDDLEKLLSDNGYSINVSEEQTNDQLWHCDKNNVLVEIEYIGKGGAKNSNVFGYYLNSSLSSFYPIFQSGNHSMYSVSEFLPGQKVDVMINLGKGDIGFGIDSQNSAHTSSNLFVTENLLNPDLQDHAIVYDLCSDEYIIAFEDLLYGSSDLDYEDMVVKVKVINCTDEVIEYNETDPDVVFDDDDTAYCQYDPTSITLEGTVYLPDGVDAKLQLSYRIVKPDDLKTNTTYVNGGIVEDGDRFSLDVSWPGIRPNDTVVEVHAGAILLNKTTNNPLMVNGATVDYYWYPWVCDPPNASYCGDGNVDPWEECDDGNNDDGDGCSGVCKFEYNFTGPFCCCGLDVSVTPKVAEQNEIVLVTADVSNLITGLAALQSEVLSVNATIYRVDEGSQTVIVENVPMTYIADGLWYYEFYVEDNESGNYIASVELVTNQTNPFIKEASYAFSVGKSMDGLTITGVSPDLININQSVRLAAEIKYDGVAVDALDISNAKLVVQMLNGSVQTYYQNNSLIVEDGIMYLDGAFNDSGVYYLDWSAEYDGQIRVAREIVVVVGWEDILYEINDTINGELISLIRDSRRYLLEVLADLEYMQKFSEEEIFLITDSVNSMSQIINYLETGEIDSEEALYEFNNIKSDLNKKLGLKLTGNVVGVDDKKKEGAFGKVTKALSDWRFIMFILLLIIFSMLMSNVLILMKMQKVIVSNQDKSNMQGNDKGKIGTKKDKDIVKGKGRQGSSKPKLRYQIFLDRAKDKIGLIKDKISNRKGDVVKRQEDRKDDGGDVRRNKGSIKGKTFGRRESKKENAGKDEDRKDKGGKKNIGKDKDGKVVNMLSDDNSSPKRRYQVLIERFIGRFRNQEDNNDIKEDRGHDIDHGNYLKSKRDYSRDDSLGMDSMVSDAKEKDSNLDDINKKVQKRPGSTNYDKVLYDSLDENVKEVGNVKRFKGSRKIKSRLKNKKINNVKAKVSRDKVVKAKSQLKGLKKNQLNEKNVLVSQKAKKGMSKDSLRSRSDQKLKSKAKTKDSNSNSNSNRDRTAKKYDSAKQKKVSQEKETDRSILRNMLYKKCSEGQEFCLNNGEKLTSVSDLLVKLSEMDYELFSFHVNSQRNDFYNWIKDVFGYEGLADKLKNVKAKDEAIKIIKEHIVDDASYEHIKRVDSKGVGS